MEKNYSSTN